MVPGRCLTHAFGRDQHVPMVGVVEADYLVVGAGAAGMAFTDALIDHADVNVVMVDRRHGVGGHWLDAYPFVRLHQASAFYGVASTLLGDARIQQDGPETGLFTSEQQHRRSARTTPGCCASGCWAPARCPSTRTVTTSARAGSYPACPGNATRFAQATRRRRPLPAPGDPVDDAGALRYRGRRARHPCQRPGPDW